MYPTKGQNKSTQALPKLTQRMFVEPILQESKMNNSSISISAPKMRELKIPKAASPLNKSMYMTHGRKSPVPQRLTPKLDIKVVDFASQFSVSARSNDTKKSAASRNQILNSQSNKPIVSSTLKHNERLLLKNFLREFNDAMNELVGYSVVSDIAD